MWLLIAMLAGPGWTEAGVGNAIKKAERAGFEQHDMDGLLRHMRPGAPWVVGRTAVPDAHDVVMSQKAVSKLLRLSYSGPPGTRRVDFLKTSVALDAEPPTAELTQSRQSPGGRVLMRTAFTLVRDAQGWGVAARREWPLEEHTGPMPTLYDTGYWLDADLAVDQPTTDTLAERFGALMGARRYAQLAHEAKALVAGGITDSQIWAFWAEATFRLGDLDEARRLARIAIKKGGTPRMPPELLR